MQPLNEFRLANVVNTTCWSSIRLGKERRSSGRTQHHGLFPFISVVSPVLILAEEAKKWFPAFEAVKEKRSIVAAQELLP